MRPNGKKFALRAVLFVVCAVAALSALGNAATASGTFKLSEDTRWGMMVLAPGEYSFAVDTETTGRTVTVRSLDTGWSGMVMAVSLSDPPQTKGTSLRLTSSEGGLYVKALNLGDLGYSLDFSSPKSGKLTRLMKPSSITMATASGSH